MRYRILVLAACLLPAAAPSPLAQAPTTANSHLEGDWVRIDPDGAGSFDGLGASIPPAQLLPGVSAGGGRGGRGRGGRGGPPAAQPSGPNPAGVPYIVVAQPCSGGGGGRSNGALLVNPDSGGVHFVEHKDEVIFAGERGGVRHFFLDGRAHPNPWTPTPAGHSVGRYEGNTLVVETTGFTPGGGTRRWRPHLGDDARRALRGVSGRPAAHHYVHLERPQDLPDAARLSLSVRTRADRELRRSAGQLCARRVVRRRRSG